MFDVAISFASADEALALQLKQIVEPPLRVFVYSKAQEMLAGKDGIEAFRTVFRNECKLAVVLFRKPWGETPWTRVEETAIKELGLEDGWDHMLFVRLDQSTPIPKWVPKPHLYLDLTKFTLSDLGGAIKARLVELGIEIVGPTVTERAAADARRWEFEAETLQFLSDSRVFDEARASLFDSLGALAPDISKAIGKEIECGVGALGVGFVLSGAEQTIAFTTHELYANTARDAYLTLTEYNQQIPVAKTGMIYHAWDGLKNAGSRRLVLRRVPSLGWCWEMNGRTQTPKATAEMVMNVFLDRIDKVRRR